MTVFVFTGDDEWAIRARRAELLTQLNVPSAGVERFDLTVDGGTALVTACSTFSLFGGVRLLDADPAHELSPEAAGVLGTALPADVHVLLRGPAAVPAGIRRRLGGDVVVETFKTPTGRAATQRIHQMARAAGLTLSAPVMARLAELGGHDLPRVASIIGQLSLIGLPSPSLTQVERLLGTSHAPGASWALTDALEAGDVATALELGAGMDPVGVVGYLASHTGKVGRILDDQLTDPDAIAGAFGLSNRFPATKLAALSQRLGKTGVARSWDLIGAADRAVKVAPDPHPALDLLLVQLADLWSGGTSPLSRR
jgi:DNA polymerase III delta subunit